METLLSVGLSNALAALVLALAVATAALVLRRPALLHALWLIVLVKLVTPPVVWLPLPWAAADAPGPAPAQVPPGADAPGSPAVAVPPPADAPPLPDLPPHADAPGDGPGEDVVFLPPRELLPPVDDAPPAPAAEEPTEAPRPADVAAVAPAGKPAPAAAGWVWAVCAVWLAGSAGWFTLAVWRLFRFRRLLRHGRPAPAALQQQAGRLAGQLGLRRCPAVWLLPGRVAPLLWAAGGPPRVFLPDSLLDQLTPGQRDALLVHELAHFKRRDHWVRWLEFVASGLYWWHPALWFARRGLREAEEQCCDAWVTSTLPGAGKAYATALLETLDFLSGARPATPLLASGLGRVSDLKRRLTMIMRGTTPRSLGRAGGLAVLALGGLLTALAPAWAQPQPRPGDPDKKGAEGAAVEKLRAELNRLQGELAKDPADLDKAKADLKKLEDELAAKQAEVAALQKKVEEARARLGQGGAKDVRIEVEIVGPDGKPGEPRIIRKLIEGLPGADGRRVIVVRDGDIKMDGDKLILRLPDGVATLPKEGEGLPWVVKPGVPAARGDADRRIDALEEQLKAILKELESLRRERRPAGPGADKGPPPGFDARAANDDVMKKLAAQADELKQRYAALTAERDAGLARLKDRGGRRGKEAAQAEAELAEAQEALKRAESARERIEALVKEKAVSEAVLKQAAADCEQRRQAVKQAEAALAQLKDGGKAFDLDAKKILDANEQQLKSIEDQLKKLADEMDRLKKAPDAGRRPDGPEARLDLPVDDKRFLPAIVALDQGEYEKALRQFDQLAREMPKGEDGLMAAAGSVRCLAALGKLDEAAKRLDDLKARLADLPPDAQAKWKDWLKKAADQGRRR
jgi:beta-lactamase regulating signal transducer with metallopeptidase domain/tetratricopeptide (TPR) repeat protein